MSSTAFWDALAPYLGAIEDNYFDVASARRLRGELREPVLVVGAGQGLIVAELKSKGLQCDGVDYSPEMIRQAKRRRGLDLLQADARAMPISNETYGSIIYATGVIDFTSDEESIRRMLDEGRRVVKPSGRIFVAFYRLSSGAEDFLVKAGLLRDNVVAHRECFEMYLLNPVQMVGWVARRAGTGRLGAVWLLVRMSVLGTMREKRLTFKVQKIFRRMKNPHKLIQTAAEKQCYRNEPEIKKLFARLGVSIKGIRAFPTCWVAEIDVANHMSSASTSSRAQELSGGHVGRPLRP